MSDKKLFENVRELIKEGWNDLPEEKGWRGTGAPGKYLEMRLGLSPSNKDTPDQGKWEVKFSSGNALMTLFHKTPGPKGSIKYMIDRFGYIGRNGRPSFRHTICGKSDKGFSIIAESGSVRVCHPEHTCPAPNWTENDLLNCVGGKLRRLLHVEGEVKSRRVRFIKAHALTEFKLTEFIDALETGRVCVDFDAYIKLSGAVRDHGVKFRVRPDAIFNFYTRVKSI